jgi:small-conductance mechanosensitive channel
MAGPFSMLAHVSCWVFAVWSFFQPETAATVFCGITFGFYVLWQVPTMVGRPTAAPPYISRRSEIEAFRRYYQIITFPAAAQDIGTTFNAFRMYGLFGLPWLLWNHLWVHAALVGVFFFLADQLVVLLTPDMYLTARARNGEPFATEQLMLLNSIREKRDAWHASFETR